MADSKKLKEKFNFTEENIEQIISLWATKEVLYNSSHEEYFKKDARAAALADIVVKANISGKSYWLKEKMHSSLQTIHICQPYTLVIDIFHVGTGHLMFLNVWKVYAI